MIIMTMMMVMITYNDDCHNYDLDGDGHHEEEDDYDNDDGGGGGHASSPMVLHTNQTH